MAQLVVPVVFSMLAVFPLMCRSKNQLGTVSIDVVGKISIVGSVTDCTPADADAWKGGRHRSCCKGLHECTEARDPNDRYFRQYPTIQMCRSACDANTPADCTLADADAWKGGRHRRCCKGLEECTEARDPNDRYFRQYPTIQMCRSACDATTPSAFEPTSKPTIQFSDTREPTTTDDWIVYEGLHCGGESMKQWDDGTDSGYGTANPDSIDGCKKECSAHTECAGFVFRESDSKCSMWKRAPLSPKPPHAGEDPSRHTCFAKMSEEKQKELCKQPSGVVSQTLMKMRNLVKRIWQESQKLQLSREKLKTQSSQQAKEKTQKEIKQHEARIANWRQYGRKHAEDVKAHYTTKFVAAKQGQDEATSTADICVRRKLLSFARASRTMHEL